MRLEIVTLPFDPANRRFDTAALAATTRGATVHRFDTRFVRLDGDPFLAVAVGLEDAAPARSPARPTYDWRDEVPEADHARFEALRDWRNRRADDDGVSRFLVLANRTLGALATTRPSSLEELAEAPGIGPIKLERYGAELLELLAADGEGAR